jgi:hypothetical protein
VSARSLLCLSVLCGAIAWASPRLSHDSSKPGSRSVMDAHNCYPYGDWWHDRIDRALSTGTPLAIEQDLAWHTDPRSGRSWSVLAHSSSAEGTEPTMEQYFFVRVRPIVEQAMRTGNRGDWPLITLNLDFKSEQPEHLRAVWALLTKYKAWLTTAPKTTDPNALQRLKVGPILVLTGSSDAQQSVFYDEVPPGDDLLVFGAVHTNTADPLAAPEILEPSAATNYRRWWNNPWSVVEKAGQPHAGEWTHAKDERLRSLVEHAHEHNLWIRFYTLDGETVREESCGGWFPSYNFGSLQAAKIRWRAARDAGVDYIASDQYEQLADLLHRTKLSSIRASRP